MGYPPTYGTVYPANPFVPGSLSFPNEESLSDTNGYGPVSFQAFNTTGNALMIMVGVGSDNVSGYLPRTYVADNAHNWWTLAGSGTAILSGKNRRVDIWVCPNAVRADPIQGTHISVGSSSIYAGMCVLYAEISGFPTYAEVDFVVAGSSFGPSSLSATATVADYVFGAELVSGSGNPAFSITAPSGWTTIGTTSTASSLTDMSSQVGQLAYDSVSPGAVTATWSWTPNELSTAVMVGFQASPTAPAQPNANWPSLKVEAAFGWQPGNMTGATPTWTDLTTRIYDTSGTALARLKAGRDYELSQPAAGDNSITFDNHDAALNPDNTASPYYPHILPEVPVRVSAFWYGRQYGLAYIYPSKWPQSWPDPQWGAVEMQGSDAIGIASQGQLPSAYGGQVLADYPYCYYPLSDYYSAPHGALFANLSRTNLKPAIGYDIAQAQAQLSTGLTLGLAGDSGTGIGISGLSAPTANDSGCGAILRDYTLPDLGPDNVTLELWGQVPTITGHAATIHLAALYSQPWNYIPSLAAGIAAGDVISVLYHSSGSTSADTITVYGVYIENVFTTLGPFNVTAGELFHLVIEVNYNSGFNQFSISAWLNGVSQGTSTPGGAGASILPINGMLMGSCLPLSGLALTTNYVIGQVAYYPWTLPAQRITSHYNTGITADSGDLVVSRLGKLAQWSGLGLPVLGTVSAPNPLIGNADQIQGATLADAAYQLTVDEGGMFYAQADSTGSLWYSSRTSLYNRTPRFIFGDNPANGECPYDPGSGFDYSDAYLFNIVSSERTISASQQLFLGTGGQAESAQFNSYGATAVEADQASEAEFMPRGPLSLPIETTSDQDAFDRANWSLAKYKQPQLRANQILVHAAANPACWPVVLGVGQGDIVTVIRRPVGGVEISLNCIVQQVEHDIGPDVWDTTITLAPYFPENAVIQLDNTSFNELQDGVLGW